MDSERETSFHEVNEKKGEKNEILGKNRVRWSFEVTGEKGVFVLFHYFRFHCYIFLHITSVCFTHDFLLNFFLLNFLISFYKTSSSNLQIYRSIFNSNLNLKSPRNVIHKRLSKKIIGIYLNTCTKVMKLEKSCRPSLPTSMINFIVWNFSSRLSLLIIHKYTFERRKS